MVRVWLVTLRDKGVEITLEIPAESDSRYRVTKIGARHLAQSWHPRGEILHIEAQR